MERVHHPNIVRLYEVVETLAKLYLVMEYAGGGELFAKITNEGRLKETDAVPLFAQAVSAIDHLVSSGNYHTFEGGTKAFTAACLGKYGKIQSR